MPRTLWNTGPACSGRQDNGAITPVPSHLKGLHLTEKKYNGWHFQVASRKSKTLPETCKKTRNKTKQKTQRERVWKKSTFHKHSQFIPKTGMGRVLVYLELTTKYVLSVGVESEVQVKLTNGGCKQGRGPLGKLGQDQRPEAPAFVFDEGGATED